VIVDVRRWQDMPMDENGIRADMIMDPTSIPGFPVITIHM